MLIHSYINKPNGMGFGDFLRGSIATKQLCLEYDIPFAIDFSLHPIGKYLNSVIQKPQIDIDSIIYLQDVPNYDIHTLRNTLKKRLSLTSLKKYDAYIYTNVWPLFGISRQVSNSIKLYLQPSIECENAIKQTLAELTEYEVIHIRVGDLLSFGTQIGDTVNHTLEQIIDSLSIVENIQRATTRPCIIMSDSTECKHILSKKYGLRCTSTIPSHMALERNLALDTLVDFFILSRARHIHQFSVHFWGSGFSDSAHWLYRIPITKHKLSPTN